MIARVTSFAFQGIDALPVDVQVQLSNGLPAFQIVGLADKAVSESRERVRGALHALGIALPPKRITVNLSPADMTKEGSHFDLPIALGLLQAMDILPADFLDDYCAMGELSLDGGLTKINGVLPASIHASAMSKGLICPAACGAEALWADEDFKVLAPRNLLEIINHVKGYSLIPRPKALQEQDNKPHKMLDMQDVKGQETAKRALEIAAAGGHNMLMSGVPGSGKSMLAARLQTILPPLSPQQALETSMIHSIAGQLKDGAILRAPPYRDPHHSASLPSLVGGGHKARPGEISLAHHGILFLDELPEFPRAVLESMRQPLETGETLIARANHHVTYPARFQLIAAMNPCRCGFLTDPAKACNKAPRCGVDYQAKLSGPLLDRIDIHIDVAAVPPEQLSQKSGGENSATVAQRVLNARMVQRARFSAFDQPDMLNAYAQGQIFDKTMALKQTQEDFLNKAATSLGLSARGYHRIIRVARTIADLAQSQAIETTHLAEALSFRRRALAQAA